MDLFVLVPRRVKMNVLMIRMEKFPYGSAPAFRASIMARLIVESGHNLIVLANGFNCTEDEFDLDGLKRLKLVNVEKYKNSYAKAIKSILNTYKIDLIFRPTSINNYVDINLGIHKYHLPYVMDSVEWYDPTNWRLKKFDLRYYIFQFMWNKVFPRADGIIAISRMIDDYYKKKLDNVVRIPTVTDCTNTDYRIKINSDEIHFIFAGCLDEGKDNILHFIEALDRVNPIDNKLFFDIYGPELVEVQKHLDEKKYLLEKYRMNIIVHGKTEQKIVYEKCMKSDFSVFFRKNRRSANAGFPTKLGECMTMGTPAITNNTGDISLVIDSGVNGFMLREDSTDEICQILRRIINMDTQHREGMRMCARKTAENFFDYHNYIDEIKKVFELAIKKKKEKY